VGAKAPADELGDEPEHRELDVTARLGLQLDHPGNLAAHAGDPGVHLWAGQELAPVGIRPGAAALPVQRRRDPDIGPAEQ
jgi:hypothetical protein